MNVESEVALAFDICLQVGHLKMIVYPIDNEVWEPRIFSSGLEQFVEEFEAFLAEVISEDFEAHQSLILRQSLGEQSQPHVVDLIITHVQVDKTFVDWDSLSDGFGSVVAALVVGQVEGLEGAVIAFQVLGNCLTSSERDFIWVQIEDFECGVLEQMLHNNIKSIVSKLVLPHWYFLEPHVILKHLTEVDSHTLADSFVDGVLNVQLLEGVITGVEHWEDTDNTIVINFIVSEVKGE